MEFSLNDVFDSNLVDDFESNPQETPVDTTSFSYISGLCAKVIDKLHDLTGKKPNFNFEFTESYYELVKRCDIINSMDFIYKMIFRYVSPNNQINVSVEDVQQDSEDEVEFYDEPNTPQEMVIVIDLIQILHQLKIPKQYIAGFLIIMIKYKYEILAGVT